MPKWSDFGNIFSTLREIDVNAIREEAERPFVITCIGHNTALDALDRLLHQGHERYPAAGPDPLDIVPLARAAERANGLGSVDMLILAIDARNTLSAAELAAFGRLEALPVPFLVALLYGDQTQAGQAFLSPMLRARTVAILDPQALDAADRLATAVLARLPGELHLAAARLLPGLRAIFARDLISSVAFTNATYALASGLPEQIPLVNVPFAAADILVLTKNQALLVYRLALAYGAPPDFQARIREVLPVVGGAFLWRQAARSLVGLIPVWGLVPKIAVSYAGTYTTGVTAWRWYESGDLVSTEQIKRISSEAIAQGRKRAAELIARARSSAAEIGAAERPSLGERLGRLNPFRRKPRELPPSQ
ncbi:hypothetical protein [Kouleothrix sp.]|uniref:hypothetical protein n=1 Tax=Kouleothrix sp. TaxID=2779161 RepID=UPI00391D9DBB